MRAKIRRIAHGLGSLRSALLGIVLLCWLLPTLVLGFFMSTRFFASLEEKTHSAIAAGAEHACILTQANIERVVELAREVVYDGELDAMVDAYASGRTGEGDYQKAVRSYLDRKFGREGFCQFALFFSQNEPNRLLYTTQGYSSAVRFEQYDRAAAEVRLETLDTNSCFFQSGERVYLLRNLYTTRLTRYGVLMLGIDMDALLEPLAAFGAQGTRWAVQLDGYTSGTLLLGGETAGFGEQNGYICYTRQAQTDDYALVLQSQADKRDVYREMNSFKQLLAGLILLILPIGILTLLFVHRRIVRPIALLEAASRRIQCGELGVTVPMHGADELGRLGRAFSAMSLRIKHLIDKSYKEEIALRDARISALQSRINPHFLNNALEMINWQARIEGSDCIAEMVEALSVLLNASMDAGEEHMASLGEELRIAQAYFYFVRLRFGDRLQTQIDVEETARKVRVPRMMVQTLLENAVEHGIAPAGGGSIRLLARVQDAQLCLQVINGGKPLTQGDRARIARMLGEPDVADGHIGIRNVQKRLRLIFGEAAGLTLYTLKSGETVAQACQPLCETGSPPHPGTDEGQGRDADEA